MASQDQRVYSQIEGTADLYMPSVYALLPQFDSWLSQSDAKSEDYVPMTSAEVPIPSKHKIFVIGLLPPSVTVTGRHLDRSASVAAITGQAYDADVDVTNPWQGGGGPSGGGTVSRSAGIVTAPGYQIGTGTGSSNIGVPAGGAGSDCTGGKIAAVYSGGKVAYDPCVSGVSIPEQYQLFHDAYVRLTGKEPTPTEIQIYVAQSRKETSGQTPGNNFGYMGNYGTAKSDSFGYQYQNGRVEYYNSYPSKEAGAEAYIRQVMRNPNAVRAAQSGDVLGYITSQAQAGYYGATVQQYYSSWPALLTNIAYAVNKASGGKTQLAGGSGLPKSAPNSCAFKESIQQYQARNKGAKGTAAWRFNDLNRYGPECPLNVDVPEEAASDNWQNTGSSNAQNANKDNSKLSFTDLNKTPVGEEFQAAQQRMIDATLRAMEIIRNTPPLKMLVNPATFKITSTKITADGSRSRSQHIIEHWGEEQDKIDASGKLAGFFASDQVGGDFYTAGQTLGSAPGITRTARQYSASYQNFLSLFLLYKNNGGMWLQDFYEQAVSSQSWYTPMNLSTLGSVYIYYDNILYIGSFDSLSLSETDTAPYTLEYSFQFSVRATFLLDQVDSPDSSYTYGAAGLFSPRMGTTSASATPTSPINQESMDPEWQSLMAAQSRSDEVTAQQLKEEAALRAADPLNAYGPQAAPTDPGGGNSKVTTPKSNAPQWLDNAMNGSGASPNPGKPKKVK